MSTNGQSLLGYSLDDYFKTTFIGSIRQAIGDSLYGINHRQTPTALLMNKERYGYTFFTRPQLNMTTNNIQGQRLFYPLLTSDRNTLQNFARCSLDPRLALQMNPTLVDPKQAFIPVMTNNLNAISGWDDYIAPTFTSQEGNYKESTSFVDGNILNFQTYDIDATFRNTRGDPILYMMYIWLLYQSFVFEGVMAPYPDMIIENEIDYNTRIYRLVMDRTNTYVRKILATGAAFPITLPIGGFFDYTKDNPINSEVYDFTIRFRCMGITYQDDILIKEFNDAVKIFNPEMKSVGNGSSGSMTKVDPYLLPVFNNRGYPRIEPSSYKLEWYVPTALYNQRLSLLFGAGYNNGAAINTLYDTLKEVESNLKNNPLSEGNINVNDYKGYADQMNSLSKAASVVQSLQGL